jgi:ATP-dependent exoDNAse (exonuclease V) beta subunit
MTRGKDRLVLVGRWPREPGEVAPEAATSHLDLLARRSPGVPDLAELMRDLAAAGGDAVNAAETRWVFPSLRAAEDPARDRRGGPFGAAGQGLPAAESLRAAADTLRRQRRTAEERARRPWNTAPSADSHAELHEEQARRRFGDDASAPEPASFRNAAAERAAARVAGTVVHRILEDFDLAADPEAELARQRERAPRLVAALAGDIDRAAAGQRVAEALGALGRGTLLPRLRRLAGGVVARELPVLLPPSDDADGAVGFVAGSIDLVYRDPDSGEWVVVDYKTDRVAGAAEIAERVARYTGQGRAYQRAVRDALGLDALPRFELWFLEADRVEVVA